MTEPRLGHLDAFSTLLSNYKKQHLINDPELDDIITSCDQLISLVNAVPSGTFISHAEPFILKTFNYLIKKDLIFPDLVLTENNDLNLLKYVTRFYRHNVISERLKIDLLTEYNIENDFLSSTKFSNIFTSFANCFFDQNFKYQASSQLKMNIAVMLRELNLDKIAYYKSLISLFESESEFCQQVKELSDLELIILSYILRFSGMTTFDNMVLNRNAFDHHQQIEIFRDSLFKLKKELVEKALKYNSKLMSYGFIKYSFNNSLNKYLPGPKIDKVVQNIDFSVENYLKSDFFSFHDNSQDNFEDVILPEDVKSKILDLTDSYLKGYFKQLKFCFKGMPGTGKTLLANTISKKMGYKLLVFNSNPTQSFSLDHLEFLLNFCHTNKIALLFDECDSLITNNHFTGSSDNWAKVFFEKQPGVVFFATNSNLSAAFLRRMNFIYNFENQNEIDQIKILNLELNKMKKQLACLKSIPIFDVDDFKKNKINLLLSGGYFQKALQLAFSKKLNQESSKGSDVTLEKNDIFEALVFLNDQVYPPTKHLDHLPQISLKKVILNSETQREIEQFINFSKNNYKFSEPSAPAASLLLYGPSGTGKTILAEAIANELGKPFFVLSAGSLLGSLVGQTEKNIQAIFSKVEDCSGVLFIDEVESLMQDRSHSSRSWEISQVNELLVRVDRFKGVFICATNMPQIIDKAFHRRFLFKVNLDFPEVSERVRLWNNFLFHLNFKEVDLLKFANKFELTGGQIRNICYKAKALNLISVNEIFSFIENEVKLEI